MDFIETFVINMDRNKDRLVSFDGMMKKLDWKYSRFPAIDGKLITREDRYKYFSKIIFLNNGEMGCALSHIKLWEKLLEGDAERILIFEDDARSYISGESLKTLVKGFYKHLSKNNITEPDMLYLGKAHDKCSKYEHVWENVYKSIHPVCMHAYIITKKGAKKLLDMAPYNAPIDMFPQKIAKKKNTTLMVFHPSIFFQDTFTTVSNLRSVSSSIRNNCECADIDIKSYVNWIVVAASIILMLVSIILIIFYFP